MKSILKKNPVCIDTAYSEWTKVGCLQKEKNVKRLNNDLTESYIAVLLAQPVKQKGKTKSVMTKCADGSKNIWEKTSDRISSITSVDL